MAVKGFHKLYDPTTITFEEWRKFMATFIRENPASGPAWDLMSGLRGPDSPSETQEMSSTDHSEAYSARRKRKYDTVEVIRHEAFFGTVGGSARHHKADSVRVPPAKKQDHFDKHVVRAAQTIGLKVEVKE